MWLISFSKGHLGQGHGFWAIFFFFFCIADFRSTGPAPHPVSQTGNKYLGFFKQFVAYQLQINRDATDHCLLFKNCAEPQLPDSGLIFLEPFRSSLIPLDDARCSNNRELFPAEFELANAQIQFWSKLVMSKIKLIMQRQSTSESES